MIVIWKRLKENGNPLTIFEIPMGFPIVLFFFFFFLLNYKHFPGVFLIIAYSIDNVYLNFWLTDKYWAVLGKDLWNSIMFECSFFNTESAASLANCVVNTNTWLFACKNGLSLVIVYWLRGDMGKYDDGGGGGVCLVSNNEFGVVLRLLWGGGANSYDPGPVSLLCRDGFDEGGGPLFTAETIEKSLLKFSFDVYLRVSVLLVDRSTSFWSVFCGFKEDEESNSVDDGSTSSSNFRLLVLLFVCLDEYISEYWFIGESTDDICWWELFVCNNIVADGNGPLSIPLWTKN
jgi:hypothetical protein